MNLAYQVGGNVRSTIKKKKKKKKMLAPLLPHFTHDPNLVGSRDPSFWLLVQPAIQLKC